jgi:hypothetical protein
MVERSWLRKNVCDNSIMLRERKSADRRQDEKDEGVVEEEVEEIEEIEEEEEQEPAGFMSRWIMFSACFMYVSPSMVLVATHASSTGGKVVRAATHCPINACEMRINARTRACFCGCSQEVMTERSLH